MCVSQTFVGYSVKKRVIDQEAVSLRPALRLPSHHQLTCGWSLQTCKSGFKLLEQTYCVLAWLRRPCTPSHSVFFIQRGLSKWINTQPRGNEPQPWPYKTPVFYPAILHLIGQPYQVPKCIITRWFFTSNCYFFEYFAQYFYRNHVTTWFT